MGFVKCDKLSLITYKLQLKTRQIITYNLKQKK